MNSKQKISTFSNGLRLVMNPMPGLKSVTVLVLVKAGTRYELRDTNGISHFLEHMVFKGTKKYPTAIDIALKIDNVGGSYNAFTDKEYTGFYVKTASMHLDVALDVVSQLVYEPLIPEKDLNTERGVILEEIKMYEDEPQAKVGREFERLIFEGSTLGWNTLGLEENIRNLKRDTFVDYMNYMYVPNRMVLAIAGDVTEKDFPKIDKYFNVDRGSSKFEEQRFTFNQKKPNSKLIFKDTEQAHIIYGYRTFGRGNKDRYVLSLMSTLLGHGMSSRLFTEIREKRGLAYYVGSSMNIYTESGYLCMRAGCKPDKSAEVIKLAEIEFEKLKNVKVGAKELRKVKEFIKGHLMLSFENSYEVADFYGEDLLLMNDVRSVDELIKGIDAVSADDIKRLANDLFVESGRNLMAIGPEKGIGGIGEIEEVRGR